MARSYRVLGWPLVLALITAGCASPRNPAPGSGADSEAGIALPPEWTDTPSPTLAPPTLTPTSTPPFGLSWATPVSADADYAGWVRLESRRAALWLPPGFEAADLGEFGDVMALMTYAMTEAMGQMAGELASAFATPIPGKPTPTLISLEEIQQSIVFDFVLAGSQVEEAALFLVGEPPKPGVDLGTAIQGALDSIQGEKTIESEFAIAGRPYPMARLVVNMLDDETGKEGRHLIYVFVIDERAWSLTYAAPAERFDALLPLFEKSAASFELIG